MIFSACVLVCEMYKSWKLGRGVPIILSADLTAHCSLFLSCFMAAPNQTLMDVHRTNSMTAVAKHFSHVGKLLQAYVLKLKVCGRLY